MKKILFIILIIANFFVNSLIQAQEGIPIYHDYLSDNLFLLHPSMAGANSCAKVRLTGRTQWFDIEDNPMLQTFSFNTHLGDNGRNGIGFIIFNDRNGYHSQKGIQLAFAHHINFGNGEYVNKLSFGIAGNFIQNQLDETSFNPDRFDPVISGTVQSSSYFNIDFGFSYHIQGFFLNASLKNALLTDRDLYTGVEEDNLRKYVGSAGYYFGNEKFHIEPSAMIQYQEYNEQLVTDTNLKFYFDLSEYNMMYIGASYRKDWSEEIYNNNYQSITPIIGVQFDKFTFAYTYTYDMSDLPISNSGFHQITLGYNFNCKKQLVRQGCPEIK